MDHAQNRSVAVLTAHSPDKSGLEPPLCTSRETGKPRLVRPGQWPTFCPQAATNRPCWHGWSEASLQSRFSRCWQSCKFGKKYFCKHTSHNPYCLCKYLHLLGLARGDVLMPEVQKNIISSWSISPSLLPLSTVSLWGLVWRVTSLR